MKAIRVLHVVTSLDPGGMENGVCNIAQTLASRGIETSVACLERSGPFASRLPKPEQVSVLGKRNGFSPFAVFSLWRMLRKSRPDVLHSHNQGPLLYSALATFWGKSIHILHGEHSQLAPWEMTPRRLRQRHRFYKACHSIHTVSHAQRDELIRLGFPSDRITAIENGVDTQRFRPRDARETRRALGLPEDGLFAGIVARFGPYKGHAAVLKAFAEAGQQLSKLRLVFLGSGGSEESRIRESSAAHPFCDRIHFLGFRQDVENCYPALDLLLLPSVNEGMSNAALEAMACEVPVLANRGSGNEAMITNDQEGWLLNDSTELPAYLSRSVAEPGTLRRLGSQARNRVLKQFDIAGMMQAYEALYRRLAE